MLNRFPLPMMLITLLGLIFASCDKGPDFNSPQVQKAWLDANEQKAIESLKSMGLNPTETGASTVKVAEFTRAVGGVCVVFIDSKNDPPQLVAAAFLYPNSKDGLSWRIDEYILAAGKDKKLETITYKKTIPRDEGVPDIAATLDVFLSRHSLERKKMSGEEAMTFF